VEEWAQKSAAARERVLDLQRKKEKRRGAVRSGLIDDANTAAASRHVMTSRDDDGGGSERNWSAATEGGLDTGGGKGDLFGDIPVGIREFMRTEKMLKERHRNKAANLAK
jgi:hypothetical protein